MSGPFTLDAYAAHLVVANELGFTFSSFADPPPEGRVLYLRHDIDYSPAFLRPMAEIENERGARATWCVQSDSLTYDVDDPALAEGIALAIAGGGWLGVHVQANHLDDDDDVVELVAREATALADRFDTPVRAASFHMPSRRAKGFSHLELPDGIANTYAPRFFTDVAYVSDSNQRWRGKNLDAELRAHVAVQLLIHPFWWRERDEPMLAKLEALAAEAGLEPDELITPEQRALADG